MSLMSKLDKRSQGEIEIVVKIKADFSWIDAIKLRLAGGKAIKEYIKRICEEHNGKC